MQQLSRKLKNIEEFFVNNQTLNYTTLFTPAGKSQNPESQMLIFLLMLQRFLGARKNNNSESQM